MNFFLFNTKYKKHILEYICLCGMRKYAKLI